MTISWTEMNIAVREAKAVLDIADWYINDMALLIRGKLRSGRVNPYTLASFKKELRNFDMRQHTWKEPS